MNLTYTAGIAMSISTNTISIVKTSLKHLLKAGAITATDYDELMAAITRPEASEAAKIQVLITRKAGAKILGISMRNFDRLLKDGTFHPIRVGKRSIRINYAEIENFCNQ